MRKLVVARYHLACYPSMMYTLQLRGTNRNVPVGGDQTMGMSQNRMFSTNKDIDKIKAYVDSSPREGSSVLEGDEGADAEEYSGNEYLEYNLGVQSGKKKKVAKKKPADWTEPELDDIDVSIPKVDCNFISDLIEVRHQQRKTYLEIREKVFEKVEEQKKKWAAANPDAAERLEKEETKKDERAKSAPIQEELQAAKARVSKVRTQLMKGIGAGSKNADNKNNDSTAPDTGLTVLKGTDVSSNADETNSLAFVPDLTDGEYEIYMHTRPEYDDGFVLIDTRTVDEITSWGMIEGAKVLPAHDMYEAFRETPEEFEEQYGFEKPKPEQTIIFYCQYGARSLMAAQILNWMGYPKVMYLDDGYYEWGKRYNVLMQRWTRHDEASGNNLKRLAAFQAAKEVQRDIAPEFNELPMEEASNYLFAETRSPGKLTAGVGLLEESERKLAEVRHRYLGTPSPPQLPSGDGESGNTLLAAQRADPVPWITKPSTQKPGSAHDQEKQQNERQKEVSADLPAGGTSLPPPQQDEEDESLSPVLASSQRKLNLSRGATATQKLAEDSQYFTLGPTMHPVTEKEVMGGIGSVLTKKKKLGGADIQEEEEEGLPATVHVPPSSPNL